MVRASTSPGKGFGVALLGALVGDLLLGAVGATPFFIQGGGPGDLAVLLLFGTLFGFMRPYAFILHLALWIGSPAGAGLALRMRGYLGAGRTAFAIVIFHGVAFGAAVLVSILGFSSSPLIYYRVQTTLVVLALLVLVPLAGRGFVVWRGGASPKLVAAPGH